jgi:type IV secretory pathway VirB4 component
MDKYMGVDRTIAKMQRWRMNNNAILSDIPFDKKRESEVLQNLYELLQSSDENLYFCGITTLITADSKQDLDNISESMQTIAAGHSMTLSPHWLRQMDAFKTTLPVAGRYIRTSRTLNTSSLTKLIPFNAQELLDDGGICYGRNQATGSMIFGNRRHLLNRHGFILAVSGSGKTFSVKTEIEQLILRYPQDNLLIIDPKGEYFDLIQWLGGEVIDIGLQSPHHINPLEYDDSARTDPIQFVKQKAEFLLSLCDAACKNGISDVQRSIIDRCLNILYTRIFDRDIDIDRLPVVTLKDFHGILKAQSDKEAVELALILEVFITGSLDVFAYPTNVDINNPRIVFGISGVSQDLWGIAMMTIMEFVKTRVQRNFHSGVDTWFFCDEFHELLGKPYTEEYMENFWKKLRSMGGGCTGITQNISDLLENKRTKNMLANSEYILMLKQSGTDPEELASLLGLSETQMGYITNNPAGTGLVKFGEKIIPFDMTVPEDSLIYRLNNSDVQPHTSK